MNQEETQIEIAGVPPSLATNVRPVERMLEAVIEKGVTAENVASLEKLVDLYERMQLREGERAFNAAFVRLQAEMPVIVAQTVIPNRGKYERFEDVMRVVGPLLQKHGFCVSFAMQSQDNRVTQTCHLRHIGGHAQSNSFTVRLGNKADSETQADCKAATTAKRNALLNALNIVIRQDVLQDEEGDASLEGSGQVISFEQAQTLREMVSDTGSDEAAFLRFAGAGKYEEIAASRYDQLFAILNRKARK